MTDILAEPALDRYLGLALFAGFTREAIAAVLGLTELRTLQAGEVLLHQGETNRAFFLVEEGELAVGRAGGDLSGALEIARLGAHEIVGDMSVLRGLPASATVRAARQTTVRVFDVDRLARRADLYAQLRANMAVAVVGRLDAATGEILVRHARELKVRDTQMSATRFIVANFVCLSLYILTLPLAQRLVQVLPVDTIVSLVFIVAFSAVAIRFLRAEGARFREYGMTLASWPRQAAVGVAWAIPVMVAVVVAKAIYVGQSGGDMPLFEWARGASGGVPSAWVVGGLVLVYSAFVFAQETVRCTIQKALEIYYAEASGIEAPVRTIAVTSLLFAATHAHLGFYFAVFAGLSGVYWALLYRRSRSYLAVTVNHALTGAWGLFVVGLPG